MISVQKRRKTSVLSEPFSRMCVSVICTHVYAAASDRLSALRPRNGLSGASSATCSRRGAATDSATNCSARQSTTTAGTMHAAASDPHTAPLWLSSIPVCRPDSEMRRCQCTKKGGKSVSQHLCPFFFR